MKKYIDIENSPKQIKVELFYHKGGMNFFTSKTERRGFYLSVVPVERKHEANGVVIESFTAFTGYKQLILEVKRYSDKAYRQSLEMIDEYETEMVEKVKFRINN